MNIRSFLKKFLPASSNTFNAKIDYLSDVIRKIDNNFTFTECCLKSLRQSFEDHILDYEQKQIDITGQVTLLNNYIAELNQKLTLNSIVCDECKNIIKEIREMIPEISSELTHATDLLKKNNNAVSELSTNIESLGSESTKIGEKIEGIIPSVEEIISNKLNRIDVLQQRVDMISSEINQVIDSLRTDIQNSEHVQSNNTVLLNNILKNVDESREKLIKVSEKREVNRSNHNINKHLWELAGQETAQYVEKNLPKCATFPTPDKLREDALQRVEIDGLYLEFGVFSGKTINHAAILKPQQKIYGFDSFNGLPETWRTGFDKNKFATDIIPDVQENVELVVGMFDETLPDFVASHPEQCAYIHIDCDLYSSTKTVFEHLKEKIVPGTVIVFDEFFNYPSWKEHEFKAFCEFVTEQNIKFEYIGYVPNWEQVSLRIL